MDGGARSFRPGPRKQRNGSVRSRHAAGLAASKRREIAHAADTDANTIETAEVGAYRLITKLQARSTIGTPPNQMEMKKFLAFSDWKVNGRPVAEDGA